MPTAREILLPRERENVPAAVAVVGVTADGVFRLDRRLEHEDFAVIVFLRWLEAEPDEEHVDSVSWAVDDVAEALSQEGAGLGCLWIPASYFEGSKLAGRGLISRGACDNTGTESRFKRGLEA